MFPPVALNETISTMPGMISQLRASSGCASDEATVSALAPGRIA